VLVGAFEKLRPVSRQGLVQYRLFGLPAAAIVLPRGWMPRGGWLGHAVPRRNDCA
jgi:hypothetical protein